MEDTVVNKDVDKGGGGGGEEENVKENIEGSDANLDMFALAELNLILVLSSLSLSLEESQNIEERRIENRKEKHNIPSLRTRKPEMNEFRSAGRQISRVHTKIRDCRHCRRM